MNLVYNLKIKTSICNSHVPATQLFLLMTRDLPAVCQIRQIPESSVSARLYVKIRDKLVLLDDGNTVQFSGFIPYKASTVQN